MIKRGYGRVEAITKNNKRGSDWQIKVLKKKECGKQPKKKKSLQLVNRAKGGGKKRKQMYRKRTLKRRKKKDREKKKGGKERGSVSAHQVN